MFSDSFYPMMTGMRSSPFPFFGMISAALQGRGFAFPDEPNNHFFFRKSVTHSSFLHIKDRKQNSSHGGTS